MNTQELLDKYRRILDNIHAGGNIYDKKNAGRLAAYRTVALIASETRLQWLLQTQAR